MKKLTVFSILAVTTLAASASAQVIVYDQTVADAVNGGNSTYGSAGALADLGLGPTAGVNDEPRTLSFGEYATAAQEGYAFTGGFDGAFDTTNGTGFGGTISIIHRGDGELRMNMGPPDAAEGFLNGVTYLTHTGPTLDTLDTQTFGYDTGNIDFALFHAVALSGSTTYVSVESYSTADDTWSLDASATNWVAWDFTSNDYNVDFTGAVAAPSVSVDGMGFYFDVNNLGFPEDDGFVNITGMTAVSVPEPSAYALLAGALALGCVISRRRRA